MSRRIEIELTSSRDDGTWTWRAAGAKEQRGTVPSTLVGGAAKVGDVLRVDADFFVDGIQIIGVVPAKGARREPERIEIIGNPKADEPLVTSTLATRGHNERGPRRDGPRSRWPPPRGPRTRRSPPRGTAPRRCRPRRCRP